MGYVRAMNEPESKPKQRRGFAAMSPEKQKSIAALGGRASHAAGTGHEWNSEAARAAGRIGGKVTRNRTKKPAAK